MERGSLVIIGPQGCGDGEVGDVCSSLGLRANGEDQDAGGCGGREGGGGGDSVCRGHKLQTAPLSEKRGRRKKARVASHVLYF